MMTMISNHSLGRLLYHHDHLLLEATSKGKDNSLLLLFGSSIVCTRLRSRRRRRRRTRRSHLTSTPFILSDSDSYREDKEVASRAIKIISTTSDGENKQVVDHVMKGISTNGVEHIQVKDDMLLETFNTINQSRDNEEISIQMREWISIIRDMFKDMDDGNISISPYDTAWVAMVPSLEEEGPSFHYMLSAKSGVPTISSKEGPQFPRALQWIIQNQLHDGSWGDAHYFHLCDRLCNTLACVIALTKWKNYILNVTPIIQRGLYFIHLQLLAMEKEYDKSSTINFQLTLMTIGFEIVFPSMLEEAKEMGISLPYECEIIKCIQKERDKKLRKIPMDVLHNNPTTLLHSLEGIHKLVDWSKIIKFQCNNGSFLFSPSSTACALMKTKNTRCLQYLNGVLQKFNNAVPNVYPVDIFERLWIVDRLQRLGLSRYFKHEIEDSLTYVYRNWSDEVGIGWASGSNIQDLDDTAMGFRLLRLNGFNVSSDAFKTFEENGKFFCFHGQTSQAISGIFNLYRASQISFRGEEILQRGQVFSREFLERKQETNEIFDKWIIAKDMHGEVKYSLEFPFYTSLQRIEAKKYVQHYGEDDIWIGKSLYRMSRVHNEIFLRLAKADFNMCQSIHQDEIRKLQRWNKRCKFDQLVFARQKVIECYFSVAATMFEPEMAFARIVWTQCCVLTTIIDDFYDTCGTLEELKQFMDAIKRWDPSSIFELSNNAKILFMGLYNTINDITNKAYIIQGRDLGPYFRSIWVRWIDSMLMEAEMCKFGCFMGSLKEYMSIACVSIALEPIILHTLFFVGPKLSDDILHHEDLHSIMYLVNVIGRLLNDTQGFKRETSEGKVSSMTIYLRDNPKSSQGEALEYFKHIIHGNMQELLKLYLQPNMVPKECKQLHFNMGRILSLFYKKLDGFSSLTEMVELVNEVLYIPIK